MVNLLNNSSDIPSSWRRVFAHGIDEIIMALICLPVFSQMLYRAEVTEEFSVHWAMAAYFVLARLSYETLGLFLFQKTIGKKIMGLRVIPYGSSHEGSELSFSQCLLRAIGMRLSFFFSWAPQAFALARYDRTHAVDWLAETRVVQWNPQIQRMKVYPVFVTVLVLYFSIQGIAMAHEQIQELGWRKPDVLLSDNWIPIQLAFGDDEE